MSAIIQIDKDDQFLAVFDCDGTLVDSQLSICAAMEKTFRDHGHEPPAPSQVRRIIGLSLEEAFVRMLPGVSPHEVEVYSEHYKMVFRAMREDKTVHEPLFPGASETIALLHNAGWLLGIATGKASHGLVATLEPHGLLKFFTTRQTVDVAKGKPDPDMMERAMKETGTPPHKTVMVGDTTYDVWKWRAAQASLQLV